MESKWLREALFAGMTANAFKLGTTLTLGWFWSRFSGCSVLYRGDSMEKIDFGNVLTVAAAGADQIQPPAYIPHSSNSVYFYIIRRVNNCGDEEHTLSATVKVSIDADGKLSGLGPNNVFEVSVEQVADSKILLIWFYCPLEQESAPAYFNVYSDGGTGQIDYENPIATIQYVGRTFYSHQSNSLDAGEYLFAIRAEDTTGTEDSSLARIKIQLTAASPGAIDILNVEAV